MKRWIARIAVICFLFLTSCAGGANYDPSVSDGSVGFQVDFIDVNGGDAILIRVGGKTMLIDTGYADTEDQLVDALKSFGVKTLDYLLITHFDKDHIGGAPKILSRFSVGRVLQPSYQKEETKPYSKYRTALSNASVPVTDVTENTTLVMGGCTFEIYPAVGDDYTEEDNDFSLVVKTSYGDISFLFAADVETQRIEEMMRQETDWSATVMKYPHHGKHSTRAESLVKATDPSYVIITDSETEPAEKKTLNFFEKRKMQLYRTANGSVSVYTDGSSVTVTQ